MQLIEIKDLKKYFGDRCILDIESLKIYEKEKVGIVGKNGCGKSTLLNIISKQIKPDEGSVKISGEITYIKQFEEIAAEDKKLSGGERINKKLNRRFNTNILIIDEPTNHLDMEKTLKIEKRLENYDGCLIIVSHNRELLDNLCTKIIEIEKGKISEYIGNYSEYIIQKQDSIKEKTNEYMKYIKEKDRLEKSINVAKNNSKGIRKTPKRMGNSEARLHKRESTEIVQKLEAHTKAIQKRLELLESVEKPEKDIEIYMKADSNSSIKSKYVIYSDNFNLKFGNNQIFKDTSFKIPTNKKVALIGGNGTGKTSLIKEILNNNVFVNSNAKIGYFSQELELLDEDKTILENVQKDTIQTEDVIRKILGRLLFKDKDVYKKVNVLSGGEKVKVAFAKILVADNNVLILDEPTNFLDVKSIEVLEELVSGYKGTVLFTSHDKRFIDNVSNYILLIENKKIIEFEGNYSEYQQYLKNKDNICKEDKLLLDIKISSLLSKLSLEKDEKQREKLEQEYKELLKKKNDNR